MKKIFTIIAIALTTTLAFAQETEAKKEAATAKFTAAIDVVYPYMWRGTKLTADKVAFQPYAAYAFSDQFTFGIWGTTNGSSDEKSYNEFDWYASYQINPTLKLMLSDYYYDATEKSGGLRNSYFKYDENAPHVMDLSVLLDFNELGAPIDFQWNTIVFGNDFKTNDNGDLSRAFSTYAELGYTYSEEKTGIDFRPFLGAAIINEIGFYGIDEDGKTGFGLSNCGLNVAKEIKVTENYSIPVFARYIYNQFGLTSIDSGNHSHNFFSLGATFTIK